MSYVYFARFGRYVKIGFASDPHKRLEQIARGGVTYPDDFDFAVKPELVHLVSSCRMRDERNMQLLFAQHWEVGEWFHWSPAFRFQMETMEFVTHAARLKDLRRTRRRLGLVGEAVKHEHWGKQTAELLADAKARRERVVLAGAA